MSIDNILVGLYIFVGLFLASVQNGNSADFGKRILFAWLTMFFWPIFLFAKTFYQLRFGRQKK